MVASSQDRDQREVEAYADDAMTLANEAWQKRFIHIVRGPTMMRGWELAYDLIRGRLGDEGRVLDVGCGPGYYSNKVWQLGANYVLGYDISEHYIAKARREFGIPGKLEFLVRSAHQPLEGTFDVVCGFAVLHHLEFRGFLLESYQRNVRPGGRMVFWEPMSHPATVAFHRFVRSAHSEDEWPLTPNDVRWLHETFKHVLVRPVNLAAMITNAASSLVFREPDNPLSRLGDRIDRGLERRSRFSPYGQMGIIVIDKPV